MALLLLFKSTPAAGGAPGPLDAWLTDPVMLGIAGIAVMCVIIFLARRMERKESEERRSALSGRNGRSQ